MKAIKLQIILNKQKEGRGGGGTVVVLKMEDSE